jgi:hypothetical protein
MARYTRDRRDYFREYQKVWLQNRKAAFFENKKCRNCKAEHGLELSFGHEHRKYCHSIFSFSKENFKAFAKKGRVLCTACRKKRTARLNKPKHGFIARYQNYGCRCKSCREAKAAYEKHRSKRKK